MNIEREKITLNVAKDVARKLRELKGDLIFEGYGAHSVCMSRAVEVLVNNHFEEARQYLKEESHG